MLRHPQSMVLGPFQARHTLCHCPQCKRQYPSEQLRALVPDGACFAFDVMVKVGTMMYLQHRSEQDIQQALADANVRISIREIGFLARRFIAYLARAHQEARAPLKKWMASHGGYVLHIDGTHEGDSPHLVTAIDALSELVLGNVKLPSENKKQITDFLHQLRRDYGEPKALVHDMASSILQAAATVFPDVPDFICHFHFLRDLGKDLFATEYYFLKKALVSKRVRRDLGLQLKQIKGLLEDQDGFESALDQIRGTFTRNAPAGTYTMAPLLIAYTLILWIQDFRHELNGLGFPFDLEKLSLFDRIQHCDAILTRIHKAGITHKRLVKLRSILRTILNDRVLRNRVKNLKRKVEIFNRLRQAMRIADGVSSSGLNDPGEPDIRTIESRVTVFRNNLSLVASSEKDSAVARMLKQIDKYWIHLFADPIVVQTSSGKTLIQPQRTNNILERFFRKLKRGHRKKGGLGSLNRALKTMLSQTPLIRNLSHDDYRRILLQGSPDLSHRFAQLDCDLVRQQHRILSRNAERVPAFIKRILRSPSFTKTLAKLIAA